MATIAERAQKRQDKLADFGDQALAVLGRVDSHFDGVNGGYERSWDHLNLVLQQGNEQVANQVKQAQFITSFAAGPFVATFLPMLASAAGIAAALGEIWDLVRPFAVSAGGKALSAGLTPPGPPPAPPPQRALHPLLTQAKTIQHQRELYRAALGLTSQALRALGPMIGLSRQPASPQLQAALGKADALGATAERTADQLSAQLKLLDARRVAAMPTDTTIEQTLWIGYLAERPSVRLSVGSGPNVIANHLRDLGLIGVDVSYVGPKKPTLVPWAKQPPNTPPGTQVGYIEDLERPGQGLMQFTYYQHGRDAFEQGRQLCKIADGLRGLAHSRTAVLLLEADQNYVEVR